MKAKFFENRALLLHLSLKHHPTWAWDAVLCTQCTEVPMKTKDGAHLLDWDRGKWSDMLGALCWNARAMPMCGSQLQKQHLCSHEWDSWEAQCVILKAAPHEKQGLTSSGKHNPTAWCAYNAVVAVCRSPHRKSEMDHKAEADNYWKILTCQPPAFTSSFKGES